MIELVLEVGHSMSDFISVVHANADDSCDHSTDNTATDHVTSDNNGNNHQMLGTSMMHAMCAATMVSDSAVCV